MADDPWSVPLLSDPSSQVLGSWIHLWFPPIVMIALVIVPWVACRVQAPRDICVFAAVFTMGTAFAATRVMRRLPGARAIVSEIFSGWPGDVGRCRA